MQKNLRSLVIIFLVSMFVFTTSCVKTPTGSSSSEDASSADSIASTVTVTPGASSVSTASTVKSSVSTASKAPVVTQKPVDMGGYTFTWASGWMTPETQINANSPLYERLFYQKVHEVEKKYNCKIKVIRFVANTENMRTYIMAGKKVADIIESMPTLIPQTAALGYLTSWDKVSGINLKDSKWNKSATAISTHKGKVYGIQFLKPEEARYSVMFNKNLLADSGINANGIYDLVRQKKWTTAKLKEYAEKVVSTHNKNGEVSVYGIGGKFDYLGNAFLSSYGASLVTKKNDRYVYDLSSSKATAAMNYYYDLVNTSKVVWLQDALLGTSSYGNVNEGSYVQGFSSGKFAFLLWESWVLNQYIKNTANFDYGILPLPLGPGQTSYVSPAQNMRVLCITSTNKDFDKLSIILNGLSEPLAGYEGSDVWWSEIESDYFRNDVKSNLEMYKTILNGSMRDYGLSCVTLESGFYHDVILDSIYWKNKTPSEAITRLNGVYTDAIDSVYNK